MIVGSLKLLKGPSPWRKVWTRPFLPLALRGTAEAQLALVVRRVGNEYHGETVLPLAAALKNARLLARPDRDWLNP